MPRDRRDFFYKKAKKEGYRSRASFKLKQINDKFNIIKPNDNVIDLGAAPGGWLQVAKEISGGNVIGVDILPIPKIEGVETIKGDIRLDATVEKIKEKLNGKADVVICDAAPDLSGNWSYDHARSIDLGESALECCFKILKLGGNFVLKVFQGDMFPNYLNKVRNRFVKVQAFSPEASRKQSAEIYVICTQMLSDAVKLNGLYSVVIEGIGSNGDGIAKINDFVVFVKDSKLGDKLNIKIRYVKPNFAFGDIVKNL